jgi:molybdate transport system ATP-binding protein
MIQFDIRKIFNSSGKSLHFDFKGAANTGEIVAIHGVSGAGKTTLLKMLSGLIKPNDGFISVGQTIWFESTANLNFATRQRDLGFLFQDYALFPNMTVLENIEFGMNKLSDKAFVDRIIEITEIGELLSKVPESLSGGQKQRVAFARSVMRKPKLLLLDEPLSALDITLRSVLQNEFLELRKLLNITILFTSHSVPEVYKLADKVLLIDKGKIAKIGTPSEVFAGGDKSVDSIGEFLSSRKVGNKRTMNILVDGKVVAVEVDQSACE